MRHVLSVSLLTIGICATSYPEGSGLDDPTSTILQMHEQDRQACMRGDSADLQSRLGDLVVVISEGNITTETKEAMYRHFVEGFQKTGPITWEEVGRPTIKVSDDGTMAWAAFAVRFTYVDKEADGKGKRVEVTTSELSTYEKKERVWLVTAMATTYPSGGQ